VSGRHADRGSEGTVVRVLHVSQPADGGTAAVVRTLVSADAAQGRSVAVASPRGALGDWAGEQGFDWTELPLGRRPEAADLRHVRALRRLLPHVDLVVLHSSKAGAVGRLALGSLPRASRPTCVFYPHAWSWYTAGPAGNVYRRFERLAARWADRIVAVSEPELRDGRRGLPRSASAKLRLIENGVDVERFVPSGLVAPRPPGPFIVCVGRLCEQKGQDLAIEALQMLGMEEVTLCLVGDGPDRSRLEHLVDDLEMERWVRFEAAQDPRPFYRSADVVLVPSRWDGMPLVLLEAMACGATVLATRAAAAGLPDGSALAIVEAPGATGIATGLRPLLRDPELRARTGRAAVALVHERYPASRVVDQYDDLVRTLTTDAVPDPLPAGEPQTA